MKLIDLTGQQFHWLTVINRAQNRGRHPYWVCRCKCGTEKEVCGSNLSSGKVVSCGCYGRERSRNLIPELAGRDFGAWHVLRPANSRKGRSYFLCRCICGTECEVRSDSLIEHKSTSCGCIKAQKLAERAYKHGQCVGGKPTKIYKAFHNMRTRCLNGQTAYYKYYGGRGVTICPEWRDNFAAFQSDMGPPPPGHSLDRIDVDGNYTPTNCRWASTFVQSRNKRSNRHIEYQGDVLIFKDWCLRLGISESRLRRMLDKHDLSMREVHMIVAAESLVEPRESYANSEQDPLAVMGGFLQSQSNPLYAEHR